MRPYTQNLSAQNTMQQRRTSGDLGAVSNWWNPYWMRLFPSSLRRKARLAKVSPCRILWVRSWSLLVGQWPMTD